MKMSFRAGVLVLLLHSLSFGQVDSLYRYQTFHLTYENDFFTASDCYYSQGIFLQYDHHNLQVKWLKHFFIPVPHIERNLESGIAQKDYTPSTILSDTLLVGDRPYAATIAYGNRFFSRSKSRNYTLMWGLSFGFIGKPAFGEYTQKTVHRWINNAQPKGWQYQLNTGFILDLNFGFTKSFFTRSRWIRLDLSDFITVGNLTDEMRVQGKLKLGYIGIRRQFYLYYTPELRVVAYDGTLQGAIFVRPSEAALPAGSIERLVSEQQIGIYLRYNRFFISGHAHYQSRLFKYALNHMWGGITVGYNLWDNYRKLGK
nr:lipid A deacylase LpxR family protein [uncultured Fluviicola sp.]